MSAIAQFVAGELSRQLAVEPGLDKVLKFDLGPDGVVVIDGTQKPNRVSNDDRPADCTMGMVGEGLRKIVAGVVYNPILNELYVAERGSGAYLNDRRLRVAARKSLADSLISVGVPHLGNPKAGSGEAQLIEARTAGCRSLGTAALELAWVASGRYDGFCHRSLEPWDFAAGILLVREAGGYVSDLTGRDKQLDAGAVVAGNEAILKDLRAVIALAPAV